MEAIEGRRARRLRPATTRARRRVHRLGHRRPADDRGDAQRAASQGGLRKISPFFVPGYDHQHDRRASCRSTYGFKGPNLATVTRLLDREPLHRRGGAADRIRRRRRHDRRRRRGDRVAARRRRLLRGARAVDAQRRSRRRRAARGTWTATASCWARAPASWCSRSCEHAKARGARSTASSPATA